MEFAIAIFITALLLVGTAAIYVFTIENAGWGPGIRIGSMDIETWLQWTVFVFVVSSYQIIRAVVHDMLGRRLQRTDLGLEPITTGATIYLLIVYNLYSWFCLIVNVILVFTKVDIWIIVVLIDTITKAIFWANRLPDKGRVPRIYF